MNQFYNRSKCRTCDNEDIHLVFSLRQSPLCDAYLERRRQQEYYDLDLLFCKACGLAQLKTVVDPEIIYRDYIYSTTSSTGLKKHFKTYATEVHSYLKMQDYLGLTIDIGSNDGTLLGFFQRKNHKVLGVEPATEIAKKANNAGISTLPDFFDMHTAKKINSQFGRAGLVTINNLFANVDNLGDFTKGLDIILDEDGVIVIETSYLLDMINNMVFDYIYHEHLSYFSILPLVEFFKKFDMKLINLQGTSTKGGSLRYYWARDKSKWTVDPCVSHLIKEERAANISLKTFEDFQKRINLVENQLLGFLETRRDQKIVGYGASATSTTLISHFQLNQYFTYLVDDNPSKIGTYSPGYHIPVFGFSRLIDDPPDLIVILAWRFKDQILAKLVDIQCPVILPLPKFKVVRP